MTPSSAHRHSKIRRGIPTAFSNLLFFLIPLFVILPHLVYAHSQPIKLEPTAGSTLTQSPPEIRLTFSEPVLPNATINLFPQNSFSPITGIIAQQDPVNPAQIFAPLPSLSSGAYTIQWQIQSSDGHTLTGTYAFNIQSVIWVKYLPRLILLIILLAAASLIRRRRQILRPKSRFINDHVSFRSFVCYKTMRQNS